MELIYGFVPTHSLGIPSSPIFLKGQPNYCWVSWHLNSPISRRSLRRWKVDWNISSRTLTRTWKVWWSCRAQRPRPQKNKGSRQDIPGNLRCEQIGGWERWSDDLRLGNMMKHDLLQRASGNRSGGWYGLCRRGRPQNSWPSRRLRGSSTAKALVWRVLIKAQTRKRSIRCLNIGYIPSTPKFSWSIIPQKTGRNSLERISASVLKA